jgi:hypothetical protein
MIAAAVVIAAVVAARAMTAAVVAAMVMVAVVVIGASGRAKGHHAEKSEDSQSGGFEVRHIRSLPTPPCRDQ